MIDNLSGSAPYQNHAALSEEEMETLRRRAWLEQHILIVSPSDKRLSAFDKTLICEIGNRFYCSDACSDSE